ncbi:MAG: Gfo/Idh/MocA family oxidoreductase, partial [Bryobacterales bacterium]|nr:Gfo/Idh/MocA family oxidoreductase [Bryobacterales bacterium]
MAIAHPEAAVADRQKRNPRLAAARHYTDYRRMLDAEKLDVVSVCNANGPRAQAILACLEHKVHIIAEKPLALTRKDLDRIKTNLHNAGTKLSTLLPMRFSPPYLAPPDRILRRNRRNHQCHLAEIIQSRQPSALDEEAGNLRRHHPLDRHPYDRPHALHQRPRNDRSLQLPRADQSPRRHRRNGKHHRLYVPPRQPGRCHAPHGLLPPRIRAHPWRRPPPPRRHQRSARIHGRHRSHSARRRPQAGKNRKTPRRRFRLSRFPRSRIQRQTHRTPVRRYLQSQPRHHRRTGGGRLGQGYQSMKHFVLSLALLALAGCGSSTPDLEERINTADEAFAPQLLSGFYHVEERSWRWTRSTFAVALKPPRKATKGAVLLMQYSLPQQALDQLKEVTITASIDGIPLPP